MRKPRAGKKGQIMKAFTWATQKGVSEAGKKASMERKVMLGSSEALKMKELHRLAKEGKKEAVILVNLAEKLADSYYRKKMTTTQIAKTMEVQYDTVIRWMRALGMPIRTRSEATGIQLERMSKQEKEKRRERMMNWSEKEGGKKRRGAMSEAQRVRWGKEKLINELSKETKNAEEIVNTIEKMLKDKKDFNHILFNVNQKYRIGLEPTNKVIKRVNEIISG